MRPMPPSASSKRTAWRSSSACCCGARRRHAPWHLTAAAVHVLLGTCQSGFLADVHRGRHARRWLHNHVAALAFRGAPACRRPCCRSAANLNVHDCKERRARWIRLVPNCPIKRTSQAAPAQAKTENIARQRLAAKAHTGSDTRGCEIRSAGNAAGGGRAAGGRDRAGQDPGRRHRRHRADGNRPDRARAPGRHQEDPRDCGRSRPRTAASASAPRCRAWRSWATRRSARPGRACSTASS